MKKQQKLPNKFAALDYLTKASKFNWRVADHLTSVID